MCLQESNTIQTSIPQKCAGPVGLSLPAPSCSIPGSILLVLLALALASTISRLASLASSSNLKHLTNKGKA